MKEPRDETLVSARLARVPCVLVDANGNACGHVTWSKKGKP